jgi:elongator complex protein 1
LVIQGDGKLVYYNTLFDMMSSVNLDDNDETFEPGQEVNEENSTILQAQITWKGDSRVFSVNYIINGGVKCLTRDIDMNIIKGPARADKENVAEKNVFSVSEKPISNMRLPIAMMPSGSLIAGFQIVPQNDSPAKHQIIFWEKNGLRHGEIDLPMFSGNLPEVKKLEFNSDSTFLAAHITFEDAEPPIQDQIIILHRSNYHWFIKKALYAP